MTSAKSTSIWRDRFDAIMEKTTQLFCIATIYLVAELAIWGISRLLSGVDCEFFSSIIGMAVVFIAVSLLAFNFPAIDSLYQKHLKPLVDWINGQMGVGFVIPLIMLDPDEILSGAEIGQIIANFVLTNVIFWLMVYYVAFYTLKATMYLADLTKTKAAAREAAETAHQPLQTSSEPPSPTESDSPPRWTSVIATVTVDKTKDAEKKESSGTSPEDSANAPSSSSTKKSINWSKVAMQYPSIISFLLIFAVGAPIAAGTGDPRALDGFATWFFWISAVRGQRCFKQSGFFSNNPRCKSALSTLLNPVLMTVFGLLAYTRAKASGLGVDVSWVLDEFSKGSPIYALWTAGGTGNDLETNRTGYFGAGDLALSVLEVGILIWGFKLCECRRQLFSSAGVVTVVISVAAAASNVYLCVVLGAALKLKAPEALAFAARSTTLALAKPAIEAIGGNVPANAGLVVSNGILGQLMYPFTLARMGVKKDAVARKLEDSNGAERSGLLNQKPTETNKPDSKPPSPTAEEHEPDDAITIAAGIAIGINGAAMGVAYLVENKSRAAPYAALSMTVFGVFTVLFTTVEPFTAAVINLASA